MSNLTMDKLTGHSKNVFSTNQLNLQYYPKFDAVNAKTNKGMIDFEKMSKRKGNVLDGIANSRDTADVKKIEEGYNIIKPCHKGTSFVRYDILANRYGSLGLPKFLIV